MLLCTCSGRTLPLCYLNDFVGVAVIKQEGQEAYLDMLTKADNLELVLSPAKCTPPSNSLDWPEHMVFIKKMTITTLTEKLKEVIWNVRPEGGKHPITQEMVKVVL